MPPSRSFKEFVKNSFDNQMWKTLEDYLSEMDPSTFELRLNRIRAIGEVELYNTELKFVDVCDLPEMAIGFDAVYDATLIVYDEDRYHNDESEAVHQWFMLRCRGDLDKRLSDLDIYCETLTSGWPKKRKLPLASFYGFFLNLTDRFMRQLQEPPSQVLLTFSGTH